MTASRARIRVLQSFRQPRPTTNPYLVGLLEATTSQVDVRTFSWRTALTGRYDVLHLHWPEVLLRGRDRPRTVVRQLLFALLMLRTMVTATAVVRTIHNVQPHERGGAIERALLRWCDRRTTLQIRLTTDLPSPLDVPEEVIPHAHYRDWFADVAVPGSVPSRLLYFGLVRPYKGVPSLIDAFRSESCGDWSLHIVGSCDDPTLRSQILSAAQADPRLTATLTYADDVELAREIGEAELVVLPYLAVGNSGAMLTALSLNRPVLMPDSPLSRAMADEVGPGWVLTYSGTLTSECLRRALTSVRTRDRAPSPDLSRRDWAITGPQHVAAYARAVGLVRGGTVSALRADS